MNYILADSDAKGVATYLETSNIYNISRFNRKDFHRYGMLEVDEDNPTTVNLMVRTPSNCK